MGIIGDIEDIKKTLEEKDLKEKEKKFRFPFGKKVGRTQKKKNFITVLLVNENRTYEFRKYKVDEQTIWHEMIPRLATSGHIIFNKKGNPMLILPNWSVEPFSPQQNFSDSLDNGSNKKGYQILMSKMKSEQVNSSKKMGGMVKWIIGAIVLGIIGYAILTGGGA